MAGPTHRFIETNGIRMHIAEQGSGPLVLLCHGFPESWYSWRHQLHALAEAGFHAVAPDMRGYGQTNQPEAIDQYTLLHLAGDMVGLLDALGDATGGDRRARLGCARGVDLGAAAPGPVSRRDRLGVPYRPRGAVRPTTVMPQTDDAVFYQLYFQTPGVAEAELERTSAASSAACCLPTLATVCCARATRGRGRVGMVPRVGGWRANLAAVTLPATLAPWLAEADVDFYAGGIHPLGFPRRVELVSQHRPKLGAAGAVRRGDGERPGAVHDRRIRPHAGLSRREGAGGDLKKFVPELREMILLPDCGHWTQQERPNEVNAAMIGFLRGL